MLVAVNGEKRPGKTGVTRAADVRAALPAGWDNVTVATWAGLTVAYCQQHGIDVIVRGVRNSADLLYEYQLAAMNETLGVTTVFLPTRPVLASMSSTAIRALQS